MTRDDAIAATRELIAGYGRKMVIAGKSREVFVDEEMDAPAYDDAGGFVDNSAVIVIGETTSLAGVKVGDTGDLDGSAYRVTEVNKLAGSIQLTMIAHSAR